MHVLMTWAVLCVFGAAGSSLCVNENEYDEGFADNYGNEISSDQQQEESPNTPHHADSSHWNKLFVASEDSQMRQNMSLESVEQCCGGMVSSRSRSDKLIRGESQQSPASSVSACRAQTQQEALRSHHSLEELRRDGAEMERRINATLQEISQSRGEDRARSNRLQEAVSENSKHQPTQRPGGLGRTFSMGVKAFPAEQEEQESSSQVDSDMIKGSSVVIARDVQKVYSQSSRVIEQAGTSKKGRGDT